MFITEFTISFMSSVAVGTSSRKDPPELARPLEPEIKAPTMLIQDSFVEFSKNLTSSAVVPLPLCVNN